MLRRLECEPATCSVAVAVARPFRVMVAQAGGAVALYRAMPTLRAARRIAQTACDRHQARLALEPRAVMAEPTRPRRVYVEQWIGSAIEGKWKPVAISMGGFSRRFEDRRPTSGKRRRKTGELVECVLLEKKTRRGGWRARIAGKSHAGPVTGDPQAGVSPGDTVRLRICSLSGRTGAAQFAWPKVAS